MGFVFYFFCVTKKTYFFSFLVYNSLNKIFNFFLIFFVILVYKITMVKIVDLIIQARIDLQDLEAKYLKNIKITFP